MIFITGDTHIPIDISKLNTSNFQYQKFLTKDDYLIICGDFGAIWANDATQKHWLKWLQEKTFTTLFVDGNHENFDLLYQFPVIDKFNGKVRQINDSVFQLCRGEIYSICDKTIFTMGGACSIDKYRRKEFISWWSQEEPNYQEWLYALDNLARHQNKVDIIITHAAPASLVYSLYRNSFTEDSVVSGLQEIYNIADYDHWYFGHYHIDADLDDKHTCLYQKIIRVE